MFTLHCLARLLLWFTNSLFLAFCYVIVLKVFEQTTDCKLDTSGPKTENRSKLEVNCMFSFHRNSSNATAFQDYDAIEFLYYDISNRLLWFYLLMSMIFIGLSGAVYENKRYPKPSNGNCPNDSQSTSKNSGFTRAATLRYLLLSLLLLIFAFAMFRLLNHRFTDFAIAWLQNFSDGKPLLARQVTCELGQYEEFPQLRLFTPINATTPTTTICRLPKNSHFEFIYLVLWFWFVLLAVVNLLVLLRCLLFAFSSTLRFRRLSVLLKGVNKQKISELAEDVDAFFKIECYAGETVELKGQQLLDVAERNSPSYSP